MLFFQLLFIFIIRDHKYSKNRAYWLRTIIKWQIARIFLYFFDIESKYMRLSPQMLSYGDYQFQ